MSGFITLERAIFENPKMRGKDDIFAAIWIVAHAAWKPMSVKPVRHPVDLERGQCAYAVSFMATAWECSKATAHARLRHFEKIGFIRTEARTDCTLITVCNYDKYQHAPNDDRTEVRTQPERSPNAPRTNKKEDNQFKEDNKDSGTSYQEGDASEAASPDLAECWSEDTIAYLRVGGVNSEKSARSMMGQWLKRHEPGEVMALVRQAQASAIVRPMPWINQALANGFAERKTAAEAKTKVKVNEDGTLAFDAARSDALLAETREQYRRWGVL